MWQQSLVTGLCVYSDIHGFRSVSGFSTSFLCCYCCCCCSEKSHTTIDGVSMATDDRIGRQRFRQRTTHENSNSYGVFIDSQLSKQFNTKFCSAMSLRSISGGLMRIKDI